MSWWLLLGITLLICLPEFLLHVFTAAAESRRDENFAAPREHALTPAGLGFVMSGWVIAATGLSIQIFRGAAGDLYYWMFAHFSLAASTWSMVTCLAIMNIQWLRIKCFRPRAATKADVARRLLPSAIASFGFVALLYVAAWSIG